MIYVKQFLIIAGISFLGEALNFFIPLSVPASIYGLAIMFTCLCAGIIPLKSVKQAGDFLVKIMPVMFIAPAVGLMESMAEIKNFFVPFLAIVLVSTVLTMGITGLTAQLILRRKK